MNIGITKKWPEERGGRTESRASQFTHLEPFLSSTGNFPPTLMLYDDGGFVADAIAIPLGGSVEIWAK